MRAWVIVVAGCTVPPPFVGLEAPSTLPSGHASLAAAGGGVCDSGGCTGGGVGRFRLGVGTRQEVNVDVAQLSDVATGGKLAYKLALHDGLALVAGVGAVRETEGMSHPFAVGGELGAIVRLADIAGNTPVFAGVRVTNAVPLQADRYADGGVVELGALSVGVAHPFAPHWSIAAELAAMAGFETSRTIGPRMFGDDSIQTGTRGGAYGAVALTFTP